MYNKVIIDSNNTKKSRFTSKKILSRAGLILASFGLTFFTPQYSISNSSQKDIQNITIKYFEGKADAADPQKLNELFKDLVKNASINQIYDFFSSIRMHLNSDGELDEISKKFLYYSEIVLGHKEEGFNYVVSIIQENPSKFYEKLSSDEEFFILIKKFFELEYDSNHDLLRKTLFYEIFKVKQKINVSTGASGPQDYRGPGKEVTLEEFNELVARANNENFNVIVMLANILNNTSNDEVHAINSIYRLLRGY